MLPLSSIVFFSPAVILSLWALGLLMAEAFLSLSPRLTGRLALVGLAMVALLTLSLPSSTISFWNHLAIWDGATRFFDLFFLAVAAIVIWMGYKLERPDSSGGEFAVLPLFTTSGLMLLASANDFMVLFVSLELVTISFYILVGYQRRNFASLEASVKYLILGGLSSAFLVMGIAYIFGLSGTTRFDTLAFFLHDQGVSVGIVFGLMLVMAGIGFKIAMVPFHIWAPDVYQGAPSSITAFLSVGSKAGGLVLLLRLVFGIFESPDTGGFWVPLLYAGAILSLLLGNLAAIPQPNLKRMLGYSSIGHTGFILVALVGAAAEVRVSSAGSPVSEQRVVAVYLATYFLASFLAFIVLAILERETPSLKTHYLAGLSQRSPLLAAAFALSMISLAGVPPLSGFIAKALVVLVAWNHHFYLLLGVTLFSAVVALYYYLGPIKAMYWSEPLERTPIRLAGSTRLLLTVLIILIVASGLWPQAISSLVAHAQVAPAAHP